MKRLLKLVLKPIWRMTRSIRTPILARFDARVGLLVSNSVNARMLPELIEPLSITLRRLERIEDSLARADRSAMALSQEVDLVLNGVSREIFRLQAQLEHLQTTLARDSRAINGGLSIRRPIGRRKPDPPRWPKRAVEGRLSLHGLSGIADRWIADCQ